MFWLYKLKKLSISITTVLESRNKTYLQEECLYVSERQQRRFIAHRRRKIEDQGNQRITIAEFALALDRGHPSRVLFLAKFIWASSIGIQIEIGHRNSARHVQVKHVEESNILVPDIGLLILDDFHIEQRLDVLEQTRQHGRQREIRPQCIIFAAR